MDGAAAERPASVEQPPPEGAGHQARATPPHVNLVDEAARVATKLNDKLPTLSQETRLHGNHREVVPDGARESQPREEVEAPGGDALHALPSPTFAERDEDIAATATHAQTDTRGGRMRQRASSVGASVGENLRPRVEKLREASTVVFDEASDDPGLRFVIIAALLFLLFLFILLFSYILG